MVAATGSAAAATFALLALAVAPAQASPFDRWVRNPYPVADGFSFPVGDGEGADPTGWRHEGWYVEMPAGAGQPVRAIAAGKVVVARRLPDPWGGVVMIEHIVLDSHDKRRVRSQYAHLSRIDVREGQIVRRRDAIGAIGKAREGDDPAALRLELRSDVALEAVGTMVVIF